MDELEVLLCEGLKKYNFKRSKKRSFKRVFDNCIQEINMCETKIKGQERVYLDISVLFTFTQLNNLIMYLKNDYSRKGWATGGGNINIISEEKVLGFYIDCDTDLAPIVAKIIDAVAKYAIPYFAACDTYEKFKVRLRENDKKVTWHLLYDIGWNLLALNILNNTEVSEETIKSFFNGKELGESEYKDLCDRICDREAVFAAMEKKR